MDASSVLDTRWDGTLPVDPEKIASFMGIKVIQELGMDGCSGRIEFENHVPVIRYDGTEVPVRQRFTIAHEIGHFALGHLNAKRAFFRDPPTNFTSNPGIQEEVSANGFAAELLMPGKIIKYVISVKKIKDIERLANLFFVSQTAMRYRLINLGIL
ncbi:MAG: ImmA/IrrE family metallo-endopeptidase [Burkholderiaceae bacterium]|nr:ImmA/IrrE family metallo-endopeptidase [Burkholderiaceae bacterium]